MAIGLDAPPATATIYAEDIMPRKMYSLLCILLAMFVLNSCALAATSAPPTAQPTATIKPTATEGPAAYVITKDTGLYASLKDEEPVDVLPVGTLVIPAKNQMFFECEEDTNSFKLCRVEVIETGQIGWVLQEWMDRYMP